MSTIEYRIETGAGAGDSVFDTVQPGDLEQVRPLPRISIHAFCESEAMQRLMERCGQDRRMAKVSLRINSGGIDAAANMFATVSTPNLIILETATEPRSLLTELAPLAAVCDPSTKVVLVGKHNDIALYRDLIRNGISEYMV
ncbi:MAG: CtpF protein, partial [Ensifer adhaerens]